MQYIPAEAFLKDLTDKNRIKKDTLESINEIN
ncbi:MAG: hypothetical protein UZ05_CHB002002424 [Chlorobi bacterium OLB5]|nr:MAG: hypothetical protein UZ05_CHB002002424 [Chlorobi bacterium OLB5]